MVNAGLHLHRLDLELTCTVILMAHVTANEDVARHNL